MNRSTFKGLSAAGLRLLALFLMLLDHLWATVIPGNNWMTWLGRLAFPIFAFQLAEGFFHTSNRKAYAKRLLVFALVAEVPFDLMYIGAPFFIFHQNVMFTLLLGFLAMWALEKARSGGTPLAWAKGAALAGLCLLGGLLGFVDYGAMGVATVLVFYLARLLPWTKLWQAAGLYLLNIRWFKGETLIFTLAGREMFFPTQGFALLALLPIWLYNGQKGRGGRLLQYGSYLFYPAHMLLLWALRTFL